MRATKIFTNKLLDKLLSKNTSKFWSLLRSKTNNNNSSSSNLTAVQISEKFKTNFIDSASNNDSVANFLHNLGNIKYENFDPGIDVKCLEKCLSHLNNSSCVDAYGLSKCYIVYAHEMLRVILVKLFNSFLTYCFTPFIFSNVIFLLLLKDKRKSADDVNNCRPIAIISILSKLFESCLSDFLSPYLTSHCNQLSFVKYGGCSKEILALKTVLTYFNNNESPVLFAY